MNKSRDWTKISANVIEGILAIVQGLLLIGLSALAMFVVYLPLSIAVIIIFGIVGSICFLYGIEALRAPARENPDTP